MTALKPWPSDAVMIVASLTGEERRENMDGIHEAVCRGCFRSLHADTHTVRLAEQHPLRHSRPVKFFCIECCLKHRRADYLTDDRGHKARQP